MTELSNKIDLVVNTLEDEMKNYIIRRFEKVEKDGTPPGSEVWLVAQNLPKVVVESRSKSMRMCLSSLRSWVLVISI